MRRARHIAGLVAALAALALPASASASWQDVIKDCSYDGKFDHHWNPGELKAADENLPSDIREYTDCKALIEAARAGTGGNSPGTSATGGNVLGASGAGSGGGGLGTSTGGGTGAAMTESGAAGTPAAVSALKRATGQAGAAKPRLEENGEAILPAASSLNSVPGSANGLPAALVLAIVAVALLCAVGGAAAGRRLWPALLRAPLRIRRR